MVSRLSVEENIKTKPLYACVFNEDTEEFIEYYYNEVASGNTIYTIDDKAMLHLNPYRMSIYGVETGVNYIVAVATRVEYRKQGLMKRLMIQAIEDMYKDGEPFAYLMPAAEAIYEPYDFVVVAAQEYYKVNGEYSEDSDDQITARDAVVEECELMAEFANEIMTSRNAVFTLRNVEYYRRLLKEQKEQNGGIKLYFSNNEIVAIAAYANEDGLKYRDLIKKDNIKIPLEDFDEHNMMARIMNVRAMLSCIPFEIIKKKELQCFNLIDEIISEQTGYYEMKSDGTLEFSKELREVDTYTIGELTRVIFENTSVVLNEIV